MAIDQTDKQLNLADRLVEQATRLDDVLDGAQSLIAQYYQAGTFEDVTLENSALQHISASDVVTLVSSFDALLTHMNAASRRDILREARK